MSKLQLKVGHYYRRRDGEIVGPLYLENHGFDRFVFDGWKYFKSGLYIEDCTTGYDLIEDMGPAPYSPTPPELSQAAKKALNPQPLVPAKATVNKALTEVSEKYFPKEQHMKEQEMTNKALGLVGKKRPLPLAVGDRVRVYSLISDFRFQKGTVEELTDEQAARISFDNGRMHYFHVRQCRRLVKKDRNIFHGKSNAEIRLAIINAWGNIGSVGANALDELLKGLGLE